MLLHCQWVTWLHQSGLQGSFMSLHSHLDILISSHFHYTESAPAKRFFSLPTITAHHSLCHSVSVHLPPLSLKTSSSTPIDIPPCFPSKIIPKSYLQEDIYVLLSHFHFPSQIHLLLSLRAGRKANECFVREWHWRSHQKASWSQVRHPP